MAKRNHNSEGQAAAHQGLAGVYTAVGKLKQASSELTTAREIYRRIGNNQRLHEVDLQRQELNRRLQPSPQ